MICSSTYVTEVDASGWERLVLYENRPAESAVVDSAPHRDESIASSSATVSVLTPVAISAASLRAVDYLAFASTDDGTGSEGTYALSTLSQGLLLIQPHLVRQALQPW